MKNIFKILGLSVLLMTASCNLDGDLENPNQVNVSGADVDLLMNAVQANFSDFYASASGTVDPLVRMRAMTGGYRYQTAYNPSSLDGLWNTAYRDVLINIRTLVPLVTEKGLTTHVAVAKILEAYTWITLVDIFGDVPQAEALNGAAGFSGWNPATTTGADVYAFAITLLGEAKAELAKTGSAVGGALARDIYYGGNRANWTALANTLELKAWMNISAIPSRAAEANGKIATFVDLTTGASKVNLIDTEAENFRYRYSNTTVPPSRHPWYDQYYGPGAGQAGGYFNTQYLHDVFGKWDPTKPTDYLAVTQDPRWRYYFYRQVGSISPQINGFDQKALGCTPGADPPHYAANGIIFCVFEPGFYGRDHGDASGTPPDSPVITAAGVYPAGGRLDNTSITNQKYSVATARGQGADGKGIQPIWMSFFTDYIKAELVAKSGNNVLAKTLLENGIRNSITQVKNFATSVSQTLTATAPSTDNYVNAVKALYDAASNKMDVIGKEYWIALHGNGLEAYNLYRRTSTPRNLQPLIQVSTDPYFRSLVYPAAYSSLNSSAVQKNANSVNKVFWDNNPDNLN